MEKLSGKPSKLLDFLLSAHQRRKEGRPTEGNRSLIIVSMLAIASMMLIATIANIVFFERDDRRYLDGLSSVVRIQNNAWDWFVVEENGSRNPISVENLYSFPVNSPSLRENKTQAHLKFYAEIDLTQENLPLQDTDTFAIVLPRFNFERGFVSVPESSQQTVFASGQRLTLYLLGREVKEKPIRVNMDIVPDKFQSQLAGALASDDVLYIADIGDHEKYESFLAAKKYGTGKSVADIARVVLAIFCLLLFLLVDSSPESMGLAIFMTMKAFGVAVARSWIPLDAAYQSFATNSILFFADFMQLFFFMQLARIGDPKKIWKWVGIGLVLAFVYALAFEQRWSIGTTSVNTELWRIRSSVFGLLCIAVALSGFYVTYTIGMYTRAAALGVASLGVVVQVAYPILRMYPAISNHELFISVYNSLEVQTPFVFAMSTFLNISTLENRVKSLASELVKKQAIEKDLELASIVQRSLMYVSAFPKHVDLAVFHKPMSFVSGDIHYVRFDNTRQSVTCLLADVTGKGVQAALKASVVAAIADMVWGRQNSSSGTNDSTSLVFSSKVQSALNRFSDSEEMLAWLCAEQNLITGQTLLFRSNAPFPIVLSLNERAAKADTQLKVIPLQNNTPDVLNLSADDFLILISDGMLDGAKMYLEFCRYLKAEVDSIVSNNQAIDAQKIRAIVLSFSASRIATDDQTLIVLRGVADKAAA